MSSVAMPESPAAVSIRALTKRFGATPVLRGIDARVPVGEFLSVFGPNGAGKTTLLRILATLVRPTSGQVEIFGHDPAAGAGAAIRAQIGVLSHQPLLFPTLTVAENLTFYGRMFAVSDLSARIDALLDTVALRDDRKRLVEQCSRGMQQRLAIARALLHAPRLLLLDEPYTGLDQAGMVVLTDALRAFHQRGGTVIMASHDFAQGLELCDRAAIVHRGRLVYAGNPVELDDPFPIWYQRCTG
jgi:heme exporter protein A